MKNKTNTVWILLTCLLAVAVFVLAAVLYRSNQTVGALRTQLAELEEAQNSLQLAVTAQGQQETAAAGNVQNVQTVRVMNGILQQQDANGQWINVASIEELQQADPVLAGREKMQELIAQNQQAVQNGTASAEELSPLLAKQIALAGATVASASQVQSAVEKTPAAQTTKPVSGTNANAAVAPAATPAPAQQPAAVDNSSSNDSDDDSSDDSSSDDNSSDSGSSDSGSSDSGSSDSGSDSDSSDSGDGEDVGWTDEIL